MTNAVEECHVTADALRALASGIRVSVDLARRAWAKRRHTPQDGPAWATARLNWAWFYEQAALRLEREVEAAASQWLRNEASMDCE